MSRPRPNPRVYRWLSATALTALAATSLTGIASTTASAAPGAGLGKHDRALLATARANGDTAVTLLIAGEAGANKSLASALNKLGADVRYRNDDVDYLRARVPIERAEDAARLAGVAAADVDETLPLDDVSPGPSGDGTGGTVTPTPQPAPGPGTPNANPYMPTRETGASQFVAANPAYDGRGVTIGIVDTGVDFTHPALSTTTTGERKVVGWVTGTDPRDDNDPTWVAMGTQVAGPVFTHDDVAYTAPAAGSYRFGVFNERDPRLGGEIGTDVNRDGNPAGSSGQFGVLWDTATNVVYVDTNQNRSFADEQAMRDYNVAYDAGYFGTDNPATPVVEAMPFTVQTDGKHKYVNIGIVSGAHGTHVAGIAAGNGLFGGEMTGAAPGAQIVSVRACLFVAGCTSHALVEGMIWLAKQANVDVINMSIGGLPALNDANNTRARIYDRLIDQTNAQMFISAGNSGAGINTVGDPSVATKVVSVGSYISRASWQANYGSDSLYEHNLHPFSSRGPREDGGLKPQVMAPGSAISTIPLWQAGSPVAGTYALPPGYGMFNGTSMAAPQATGAAALLLSAAEQAGAQSRPEQLRQAITSSARFVDGARIPAYHQGNGLIDVAAAWDLLRTNIKPVEISSSVPVNTVLSGFLSTPGEGIGIYDREGVTAGTTYTRQYTFTRRSGGSKAVRYNLAWVGNDGTFSTAVSSLDLPLNQPVTLDVTVSPATPGAHSALLRLDDPATAGVDHTTMNVVVAASQFNAANSYSLTFTGMADRNQAVSHFVAVPDGVPAMQVTLSGPSATAGTGQVRFLRFHPYGVGTDSNTSTNCYQPSAGSCSGGSPTLRTTISPTAGVWEIVVEARRTSDTASAPYTLGVSLLGASVSPSPDVIANASSGVPVNRSYEITNLFGAFTGKATGTTLGSARRGEFSISNLEVQNYAVTVTPGTTSLRATIGSPSDPAADLDLFVFNCTTGTCVLAGQAADGDSEESVTINNPAAGEWRVMVDGFAVPAGTTTYDYVDVFVNPAFGSVAVTDADALRPSGAVWTVPGTVTASAAPAAGRVLLGAVQVRTSNNSLVGSGEVVVESVS